MQLIATSVFPLCTFVAAAAARFHNDAAYANRVLESAVRARSTRLSRAASSPAPVASRDEPASAIPSCGKKATAATGAREASSSSAGREGRRRVDENKHRPEDKGTHVGCAEDTGPAPYVHTRRAAINEFFNSSTNFCSARQSSTNDASVERGCGGCVIRARGLRQASVSREKTRAVHCAALLSIPSPTVRA